MTTTPRSTAFPAPAVSGTPSLSGASPVAQRVDTQPSRFPQNGHGGAVYHLSRSLGIAPDAFLDFSSNANSLCDDLTHTILSKLTVPYRHYPDSACAALREHLAAHEGVSPDCILPGNGSSENIHLAIQQLRPRHAIILAPIFSEYVRACQIFGTRVTLVPCSPEHGFSCTETELSLLANTDADMAILCSPNNPACVTYTNIAAILNRLRVKTALIDTTYSEFLWGQADYAGSRFSALAAMARSGTDIVAVQSFTKFFYCTGVRLGYSVATPEVTARLEQGKIPWSVSTFAEQAGIAFLQHISLYRERLPALRQERAAFAHALRTAKTGEGEGLPLFKKETIFEGVNFVIAQLFRPADAAALQDHLTHHGLLVRVCDSIPGMPVGFLRMQVRERRAWEHLIQTMATFSRPCPTRPTGLTSDV